jgi:high-affinity Fe2+/Pb2+ permease
MKKIAGPVIGSFLASFVVGGVMAYAAWEHNAQGEAHDETGVHYGFLLGVFASWAVVVMGVLSPFMIGWLFLEARRGRRSG